MPVFFVYVLKTTSVEDPRKNNLSASEIAILTENVAVKLARSASPYG